MCNLLVNLLSTHQAPKMANVQELFENQKRIEECLASRMEEFEKSFRTASSSESKPQLDKLAEDFRTFKDTVWSDSDSFIA